MFYSIPPDYAELNALLDLLSQALKKHNMWPLCVPEDSAFESTQPFCLDTMTFNEWLAFVFIPKMKALIESAQPIPAMKIKPAMDVYFPSAPQGVSNAVEAIDQWSSTANSVKA